MVKVIVFSTMTFELILNRSLLTLIILHLFILCKNFLIISINKYLLIIYRYLKKSQHQIMIKIKVYISILSLYQPK